MSCFYCNRLVEREIALRGVKRARFAALPPRIDADVWARSRAAAPMAALLELAGQEPEVIARSLLQVQGNVGTSEPNPERTTP